jgi:hypothetical protein
MTFIFDRETYNLIGPWNSGIYISMFSPNWADITVHTTNELILAHLRLTSHVHITFQVDFSQLENIPDIFKS